MTAYIVQPFDVLFFRKNKPFDFGEWYSEGFFPPLPSTFQGFVRTIILLKHHLLFKGKPKSEAQKIIGDDTTLPLNIMGPYLFSKLNKMVYFPTPRDIIVTKNTNKTIEGRQILLSEHSIYTDLGKLHFAEETGKVQFAYTLERFLSVQELNAYRQNGYFVSENPISPLVETEEHYGIKLKNNKEIEEHYFYLTPYQRLSKNVLLYFEVDSNHPIHNLTGQYSRLGSEGRAAVIAEKINPSLNLKLDLSFYEELTKSKQFKIIFLQPVVLPKDFFPFTFQYNNGIHPINWQGLSLQLLYAAIDERLKISGLSFIQNTQNVHNQKSNYALKPMVNAWPSGTVLYFKILSNNLSNIDLAKKLQKLDGGKITFPPYSNMGFNQFVFGKIN